MRYFAELDTTGIVLRVIVADDINWIADNLGGIWIETSIGGSLRKNYAGIGYKYDSTRDAFIAPKPYPSWLLDEATCQWQTPTPMPTDGKRYSWDEPTLAWKVIL